MSVRPLGILLTGGASSRMGLDKAAIEIDGISLARRTADMLARQTFAAVEVGPGHSALPCVEETPPGDGPLAGVVAGWKELVQRTGEKAPAVVLACDLPELSTAFVAWLASRPGSHSVVPVVEGRAQPLCARWGVEDLLRASTLLASGERSLRDVFGPDASFVDETVWGDVTSPGALGDVDLPEELARRAISAPLSGDDWVGMGLSALPTERATSWATRADCGAVVIFLGCVRDHAEGRQGVEELVYEAYEGPALERMRSVVAEARRRWPSLGRLAVLHRLGSLAVSETAVVVVVSSAHRHDAFSAGAFVIDTVKETVPIWKRERWTDGEDWGTDARPVTSI